MINNNWRPPFEKKMLSAVVCAGFLALAPNAHAGLVLTASTVIELPDSALPTSTDSDTNGISVNALSTLSDDSGRSGAAAWGNDDGLMISQVGGTGVFTAESTIQQSVDFTNTTGSIQNYFFDFTIESGGLVAYTDEPLFGSEFAIAGNRVSISLNGTEIFNSAAEMTVDSAGTRLDTEGLVLGTYPGERTYSWVGLSDTLNLGTFGVGETFTLDYDITTFASSNVAVSTTCPDLGYGDGAPPFCAVNFARSVFGDPNSLSSMPISSLVSSVPASVPAPSALFLLGGGIAALAYSRRRKQRNN